MQSSVTHKPWPRACAACAYSLSIRRLRMRDQSISKSMKSVTFKSCRICNISIAMACAMAARRSKSAPHMHVLVCICSNVRQFSQLWHAQLSFWLIVLRLAVFWQPQPLASILQTQPLPYHTDTGLALNRPDLLGLVEVGSSDGRGGEGYAGLTIQPGFFVGSNTA